MLRSVMIAVVCLAASAATVSAQDSARPAGPTSEAPQETAEARLFRVLRLGELMPILGDEAVAQAGESGAELFGENAPGWQDVVARINETGRMQGIFRAALQGAVEDQSVEQIDQAIDFYETTLGAELLTLELSARQAMMRPGGEEDARSSFARATAIHAPRVEAIRTLMESADLIEPNVAGALNAAYAFSQGYGDGGGFQMPLTDDQLLDQTRAQEPAVRAETTGWMEAYLMLAYSPLSDEELLRYQEFATSPAGKALSVVLFAAFDALFSQTAREMGYAAAGQAKGQTL